MGAAFNGAAVDTRQGWHANGWGVAIGAYPGMIAPAIAHLKVADDGGVTIGVGGHEMGLGGPVYGSHVTFSYIAHFIEVRIEPGTRRIRVPRSSASPIAAT